MAKGDRKHGKTAAVVGGGALLVWLLLRGEGFGFSRKPSRATSARRLRIRISDVGISVGGEPATFDEAVARGRAAGSAEVFATGAARYGTVEDLIAALRDAGVQVWDVGDARA